MKFIDPLATMLYMGGAPPIHLSMAIYAIYVKYNEVDNFCQQYKDVRDRTMDVFFILWAHLACIAIYILRKTLPTM